MMLDAIDFSLFTNIILVINILLLLGIWWTMRIGDKHIKEIERLLEKRRAESLYEQQIDQEKTAGINDDKAL